MTPFWLFNDLPEPDCLAPRDRLRLAKTGDILFLATLLARYESTQYFLEMIGPGRCRAFFPEPGGADSSTPVEPTGISSKANAAEIWSRIRDRFFPHQQAHGMDGFRVRSRISAATIRTSIRDRYFSFRQLLREENQARFEIVVHGVPMRNRSDEIWDFGSNLKRPFKKSADPLLRDFNQVEFLKWNQAEEDLSSVDHALGDPVEPPSQPDEPAKAPVETTGTILYCPLDGPVQPLKLKLRTSPESWKRLGGREWVHLVCPHCLGQFKHKLRMIG